MLANNPGSQESSGDWEQLAHFSPTYGTDGVIVDGSGGASSTGATGSIGTKDGPAFSAGATFSSPISMFFAALLLAISASIASVVKLLRFFAALFLAISASIASVVKLLRLKVPPGLRFFAALFLAISASIASVVKLLRFLIAALFLAISASIASVVKLLRYLIAALLLAISASIASVVKLLRFKAPPGLSGSFFHPSIVYIWVALSLVSLITLTGSLSPAHLDNGFGFAIHANTDETAPRVKTPLGGLKGYYKISQNGRKYETYEGIPYALPPVGKLRFKPPRPIPAWTGDLPATNFGSMCIQYQQIPDTPPEKDVGAEDCLYLNIYVPTREKGRNTTLLPVLFWIHYGSFQFGSGMLSGAKYLMDHDVIFVTFNYRLGPMGFLSTEDEVVPGNMGLKDQSMALRWVSENIKWFGGDPKKVTLVGTSAGGASVHYHYLSQLSANLFRGGISSSATALDCWTQTENSLEKAKKLSALMGCPTTTTREMIRCLRYRPARAIVQATSEFMPFLYNPFTPFGPVVEKFGDEAPFIDRTPVEIINSGDVQDVPWVTGIMSEEGLYPVAEFIAKDEILKELNDNWDILGPHFLDFNYTIPKEKHAEIARLIKTHYFGEKPIDRQSTKELIQMSGDRFFVVDSEKAARMQSEVNQNPVWFYYFSYRGAQRLSDSFSGTTENYGVFHGEDVFYILNNPWLNPTTTQKDRDMQKQLIDFWVSFATEGIPKVANVEWPKLDPSKKELHYLHIAGPDQINMDSNANLGEKEFWNSINFNENVLKHTAGINKEEL